MPSSRERPSSRLELSGVRVLGRGAEDRRVFRSTFEFHSSA